MKLTRSEWTGYAVAVLGTALVVGVRLVFWEALGDSVPLLPFAIPLFWAGWVGGGRPALLALALAIGVSIPLFIPTDSPQLVETSDAFRIGLFAIFGGAAALLCEALHRARQQTRAHAHAVHQNEEHLRLALDAARLGTWEWKLPDGEMYWSPETYALLGVPRGEPASFERFQALLSPDEAERQRRAVEHALERGDFQTDFDLAHPDDPPGTIRHLSARGRVLKDESGRNDRLLGVVADITERRRAEAAVRASESRVSGILDSITDAVAAFDARMRFTYLNSAARRLFAGQGLDPDALIGKRMFEESFVELRGHEVHEQMERSLAERIAVEFEVLYQPWDRWYAVRVYPAEDGGIVAYFQDVSERRELRAQIERQARVFDAALSSIRDYVYILRPDGRFTYANKALLELWGIGAAELPHKSLDDLGYPRAAQALILREVREVQESGRPRTNVVDYTSRSGRAGKYENVMSPLVDASGRVVAVAGAGRDVTERIRVARALEESEERFRELANNIAQFAWSCDRLGSATWYNQRWYDYTGTTFEEMRGYGWRKVQHPDHVARVEAGVRHSLESGEAWEDSFPIRAKDGSYRWFLTRAVPIRDESGTVVRWFGTNTDVTEQRELADALRDADRRKDEFLAVLAHELRNPLAPIRNAVQIQKLRAPRDPELIWSRDVIDRQVQQMGRLLDDLLDVSRISRSRLELRPEPVTLADVLASAIETSRPGIKDRGHELAVRLPDEPVWLDADATRLSQVFSNLLNNAAKFMDDGGHISVTADVRSDRVEVRVRDRGIGIAPELLPHIFDMFTQAAPADARSRDGLGIGLSLSRGLVELHGGTIAAESAGSGAGAELIVTLPLAAPPSARATSPAATEPAANGPTGTRRRLLVVDDLEDSAESLALVLRRLGHEVFVARDGEEAIEAARTLLPDVVLLDIGMPRVDGYEACRRIRSEPWGAEMFLVAITGWGQEEDRRQSELAGFDRHVVKPIDPEELVALIAAPPVSA